MDRASDFGSEGWGFESLRARQGFRGLSDPTDTDWCRLVAVRYPTKNPPLRLRGLAVDLENPRRPGSGVRASPATGLVGQRRRSSVPIADRTDPGCGRTPPDDHPRLCNTFLGPTMSAVRL